MSLTPLLPIDITPAGFKTWCEAVSAEADALGTAAVADVTTTQTDPTVGRLVKVGDFGLGETDEFPVAPNSDLNDIVAAGFYTASGSDALNRPGPSTILHLTRVNSDRYTQVAFGGLANAADAPNLWVRQFNSFGWGPWRKIYHEASILGTVSQASGVPTGAIIERDANDNGAYVKFADGTLICTRSVTITPVNIGTTFTFPATFIDIPVPSFGSRGDISSGNQRKTLRDSIIRAFTTTSQLRLEKSEDYTEVELVYGLFAIGRWY